jgi:primosomal protein N' (replication factor Y) (superfamily II helicase)
MQSTQLEILLPNAAPRGFDYLAPASMALAVGDIVSVPFGSGQSLGVVWGEGTASLPVGKIKTITQHLLQFPALSPAMRQFMEWSAWYNCAPKGAMLKMVLPIADIAKAGRVAINTEINTSAITLATLSAIQQDAAQTLLEKIAKGFSVSLLDGVTGSGKTEVYFELIASLLHTQPDHQMLVLLPEIALSVQWLERFERRFGFKPIVWNSEITPAQKRAAWQAIAKGEARMVVGARSALFLPYKKLSLIIADEEHDGSYKQGDGVMYHARDMAVARGRFEKIPVVLVSATPSLETYHNSKQGKYTEVSLSARHNQAVLPDIEMIDMRKTPIERGSFVCDTLRKALADALANGHQSLLFLNRRGYAPLVLCRSCGHRFQCEECSSWLVMHQSKPRLECHHCGYRIPIPKTCPSCGAEDSLHACGPGVERLLEEVHAFLPQARVAVMASDSMSGYGELSETINAMTEKRIDILIGTQMIAKGHHFAGLAVVGVVDADLGLAGGDLRASEHTYQLLHQLSGRAGRETIAGRVYLQSFLPDHPVMKALVSGDRDAFLSTELQARQNATMPPFTRLSAIIVEGAREEQVMKTSRDLAASFPREPSLQLWGPAPAPLFMLRGKFRYRLLVKAERTVNLPDTIRRWIDNQSPPSNVKIKIDMDPQSFM